MEYNIIKCQNLITIFVFISLKCRLAESLADQSKGSRWPVSEQSVSGRWPIANQTIGQSSVSDCLPTASRLLANRSLTARWPLVNCSPTTHRQLAIRLTVYIDFGFSVLLEGFVMAVVESRLLLWKAQILHSPSGSVDCKEAEETLLGASFVLEKLCIWGLWQSALQTESWEDFCSYLLRMEPAMFYEMPQKSHRNWQSRTQCSICP